MFAGNIGVVQSVETIIKAASLTQDIENLHWHIVGDGSELEIIKKSAEKLANVFFYGRQPLEKMPEFYSKADAMLVTKHIIDESNFGFCANAGDALGLAEQVRKFIASSDKQKMSENAVKYYIANFKKDIFLKS